MHAARASTRVLKSGNVVKCPHFLFFQFDDSDDKEPPYEDLRYDYELGNPSEDGSFASFYHR